MAKKHVEIFIFWKKDGGLVKDHTFPRIFFFNPPLSKTLVPGSCCQSNGGEYIPSNGLSGVSKVVWECFSFVSGDFASGIEAKWWKMWIS